MHKRMPLIAIALLALVAAPVPALAASVAGARPAQVAEAKPAGIITITFDIVLGAGPSRHLEAPQELQVLVFAKNKDAGEKWVELERGSVSGNVVRIDGARYDHAYVVAVAWRNVTGPNGKIERKSYIYREQFNGFDAKAFKKGYTAVLAKVDDDVGKAVKKAIKRAISDPASTYIRTWVAIKSAVREAQENEASGLGSAIGRTFTDIPGAFGL